MGSGPILGGRTRVQDQVGKSGFTGLARWLQDSLCGFEILTKERDEACNGSRLPREECFQPHVQANAITVSHRAGCGDQQVFERIDLKNEGSGRFSLENPQLATNGIAME